MTWLLRFLGWLLWWRRPEAEASEDFVIANRSMRRAAMRAQRLKGPGYTRAYRKGRTQRERHP